MLDIIKTYLPQVAAVVAAFVVGWAAKRGITLDAQQVAALMIAVFTVVERAISALTNPSNAATPKALRAAKLQLDQAGEPSIRSAMRSGASRAGPVVRDD